MQKDKLSSGDDWHSHAYGELYGWEDIKEETDSEYYLIKDECECDEDEDEDEDEFECLEDNTPEGWERLLLDPDEDEDAWDFGPNY